MQASLAREQKKQFTDTRQFKAAQAKMEEIKSLEKELANIVPLISKVDSECELQSNQAKVSRYCRVAVILPMMMLTFPTRTLERVKLRQ